MVGEAAAGRSEPDPASVRLDERGAGLAGQGRDLLGDGRGGQLVGVGHRAHGAEAAQLEQQVEPAYVHVSDCPLFMNGVSINLTWTRTVSSSSLDP